MAFSQSTITTGPFVVFDGSDYLIRWTSSAPVGTIFQVYIGGRIVYSGTSTSCLVPQIDRGSTIQVGTVGAGEGRTNFASSLPAVAGQRQRPTLAWYGGRYKAPDLVAFVVRQSLTAGAPVGIDPVATIPAAPWGMWQDGFGRGRFGRGTLRYAEVQYTWTGSPLSGGVWTFEVRPVDAAGNEGPATTTTLTVVAAPNSPALDGNGKRLTLSYNSTSRVATLNWLASP